MSRGPLEVLRDMRADAACTVHRDVCEECKAYDEAIAQVEALAEGMRDVLNLGRGTSGRIILELDDEARARECLAPFSPGQDSQKCGCTQIDYIKGRACKSCVEAQEGQDSEGGGNG